MSADQRRRCWAGCGRCWKPGRACDHSDRRAGRLGPCGEARSTISLGIGYAAIWSEAYALLEKLEIPPKVLHEVVSSSGLNCGNFQNYSKYVLEGDPNAHKFALANCLKDLTYYNRLAAGQQAPTLVSDGILQTLKLGNNLGHGERYMPEMIEIFRSLNGTR